MTSMFSLPDSDDDQFMPSSGYVRAHSSLGSIYNLCCVLALHAGLNSCNIHNYVSAFVAILIGFNHGMCAFHVVGN